MKWSNWWLGICVLGAMGAIGTSCLGAEMRPPAYPLVVHDPYFSIWSNTDELADSFPVHWTGNTHALSSFVKVDGQNFRLMGASNPEVSKMKQVSVTVQATRTIYVFEQAGVRVTLKFTSPVLPGNLMIFSRPVTYLTWEVVSTDGATHDVQIYYDNSAELCVNTPDQRVVGKRLETKQLDVLCMGSEEQPVLGKGGDNVRMDWGWQYLAVKKTAGTKTRIASDVAARKEFLDAGKLPTEDDTHFPRPAQQDWPVLACVFDLAKLSDAQTCGVMIAYDDEYSLEFLGERLRPYWRKDGMEALEMLDLAAAQQAELTKRCEAFDAQLIADTTKAGGDRYAELCALSYRHACGAHKLAALPNGKLILVSKECFSGGCAATVDVLYPTAPLFMVYSTELLKATLTPVMEYTRHGNWRFPYAPHDVGWYPLLNGQVYGGGEKTEVNQMPVEETGNMLILFDIIARLEGNTDYAAEYWDILEKWAEYLLDKGLDPENQLCTDDFAGHLAHNVNLSAKAILALACYADLCQRHGKPAEAKKFRAKAEEFAQKWVSMADDGDHFRLAFDQPGTWSQKYNLVWDRLLQLNLFPKEVTTKEIAYYKTVMKRYGLPLDNRSDYTKLDWQVWTATMAGNRADFESLLAPAFDFVSATSKRVPMTDWYYSSTADWRGFQARSVVGGVFIQLLDKENTK